MLFIMALWKLVVFLSVGEQQEIQAVRSDDQSGDDPRPSVVNEPLSEYQVSHLATMSFLTLFPDGKGNPTNQGLLRNCKRVYHVQLIGITTL